MNNPLPVFEALQKILGPLPFSEHEATEIYPQIRAKLDQLKGWGVDTRLIDLIDESARVMLRMREGDVCAAAATVMSEIEEWKTTHPIWLKPEP